MERFEFECEWYADFMSCYELEEFMVERYDNPYEGEAIFQGDFVMMGGFPVEVNSESILIVSPKYKGVVWLVTDINKDGWFRLSILKDYAQFDQLPSVDLPNYVKYQLIEVLQGKW